MANDRLPKAGASLPACPAPLSVSDTGVAGVDPQLVIVTKSGGPATRNFTCYADKPSTYSEYLAKLADVEELWWGDLFYDAAGFPTFDLTFQDPYQDYAQTTRKIVTFKEYFEVPTPGAAPAARYKVLSDTGNPPFAYVERTNVVGGAAPDACSGGFANKDYSATYNFLMCAEGGAAPVPAPAAPAVVATPPSTPAPAPAVPAVVASPPPSPAPAPVPAPAAAPVPPPSPSASPAVVVASPPPAAPASGSAAAALSAAGAALAAVAAAALA